MATQTTNGKATQTTARRGFRAPCPKCSEDNVQVSLQDVGQYYCPDCEGEFTAGDVRQFIAAWTAVLAWVELAPVVIED